MSTSPHTLIQANDVHANDFHVGDFHAGDFRAGDFRAGDAFANNDHICNPPKRANRSVRSSRFFRALAVGLCIATTLSWSQIGEAAKERLIPAKWGAKSSGSGQTWTCDTHGRTHIGGSYLLSNMNINGAQFQPTSPPLMTPDGSEYVLRGRAGNVTVERRLRVHPKLKGARVVDKLTNSTASPMKVTLGIMGHVNVRPTGFFTASGASGSRQLSAKDIGVYSQVRGGLNGTILWYLRSQKAALRPFVRAANGNQNLTFSFSLTIQPNRSISVIVGARVLSGTTITKDKIAREFRQFTSSRWTRDLPRAIRRSLVNMGRGGWNAFGDAALTQPIETELGLTPTSFDVLALGENTLVQGKASCTSLSVKTGHGNVDIALDHVAAIVGARNGKLSPRVYLRDGQRLLGLLSAKDLRFKMTSGATVDLSMDRLDRLVMSKPNDASTLGGVSGNGLGPDSSSVDEQENWLVMTREGHVLRSKKTTGTLGIASSWGPLELPLEDIRMVRPLDEEFPGYVVQLKDGTRLRAFLRDSKLELENELLGKIVVNGHELRALQYEEPMPAEEEEESLFHRERDERDENDMSTRPHAVLLGGDVILGRIDLDTLHFRAAGETLPVSPSQLRILRNAESGDIADPLHVHEFQAEIWGGGQIFGSLQEVMIPMETDRGRMMVPVRDIIEIHVPTPVIPDALLSRLTKTIQDLGHSSWERREAAYLQLTEMGDVARLPMEQALRLTKDPEVERRLRRLLRELGEEN